MNELTAGGAKVVNMIIESYIKVYGREKWDSLTTDQQHDAIMIMAKTFMKIWE